MAKAAYPTIGIAALVMFGIVYLIGCLRIRKPWVLSGCRKKGAMEGILLLLHYREGGVWSIAPIIKHGRGIPCHTLYRIMLLKKFNFLAFTIYYLLPNKFLYEATNSL